ncbi:hypothetical protein CK500_11975 [Halorubrum salipaludis]|uniref:DUF1102 domain-containing protein n=1 Tax=Halorubrum salipaludis TaxID=2032630 RepID=A0A2A2FDM1_9EURY|nr:hypothetical protein [Halorubrum salipaludis]PAU82844.1 hypothetical protein CK500_11975 [Halorubrum salipaludis]
MKRRTLLATLGVTAAGTAMGTGAFTSVEATRTVNVNIADEDEALLAMEPIDQTITDDEERGEIRLSFDEDVGDDSNGRGPGSKSTYLFDRLFRVTNQGTQDVFFESDFEKTYGDQDIGEIGFYVAETDDSLLDGESAVVKLEPGQAAEIGTLIDTQGVDPEFDNNEEFDFDATITASDEEPDDGVTVLDNEGEEEDDGVSGQ